MIPQLNQEKPSMNQPNSSNPFLIEVPSEITHTPPICLDELEDFEEIVWSRTFMQPAWLAPYEGTA